nr:IS1 family transposase [Methylosinus sp. Sm6]
MDSQRSAQAARTESRKRAGDLDARRDVAFHPKKTRKLWIWRAYDPVARRTVAWIVGGRDDETCQKLLDKIGVEGKTFVTDDWDGYHRLIEEDQLFTGKDLTVPIERDNSNVRHFLARFRRRTKVVSKSQEMVDLSLRLYHHLHDNLEALAEKLSAFRAIFS